VRVLVTGAAGMLGQDLVDACRSARHDVVALTREELDITDPDAIDDAIEFARPHAVANCAAFTDVDGAEAGERAAMLVNDQGAAFLAAAAARVGAKILYPSSDYVFPGTKRSPYVESDLPGAISAYGRSKQAGETSVAVANPKHFVVRASWLYGVHGRNFVETMLRLAREQPEVMVVSDQVGCPTYTRHLAAALVKLLEGDAYGVHHAAGGGQCSWYEFAQEIFDQAGVECRVLSASTAELRRPAPRPAYSVLRSERGQLSPMPGWRDGLREYMAEREHAGAAA
jgi:dTDP-4-dehydrorhamnose reductase